MPQKREKISKSSNQKQENPPPPSQSLDEIRKELLQSEKFVIIGKLAGGVAHEINNPIMAILNYASLFLDDLEKKSLKEMDDLEHIEYLQEIIRLCEHISKITKNLLEFARPKQKTKTIQEFEPLLINILNLLNPFIIKFQIRIQLDLPSITHQSKINSSEMQEAIINLINNSIYALNEKYPKNEQFKEKKYIRIGIQDETSKNAQGSQKYIVTEIYDDGCGISDEIKKNLFNPFFTTKKSKPDIDLGSQGLGLGLYRSNTIVEDHGGYIKWESKMGEYSSFKIYLPLVENKKNLIEF